MKTGTVLLGCKKQIGSTKRSKTSKQPDSITIMTDSGPIKVPNFAKYQLFEKGDKVKYLGRPAVIRAKSGDWKNGFLYDIKYESENEKRVARQVSASTLEKITQR